MASKTSFMSAIVLLSIAGTLACDPEAPPPPASYVLSDGTAVDVASDGSLRLSRDGRALGGLSSGRPTGRRYTERVNTAQGSYDFRRFGETLVPADRFLGSEADALGVTLRYEGEGIRAEVRIAVEAPSVSTRVTTHVEVDGAPLQSVAVPTLCDPDASFLGFGAQYNAVDQRGESFALFVEEQGIGRGGGLIAGGPHTTYFAMPYWLDLRGFGVLTETPFRTLVDLCAADADTAWVEVESDADVELLIFHGPAPLDVVRELGDRLGRPPLPPDWAFSTWVGVQGGRDAVLSAETRLRAAGVPFSALWAQDWTGAREFAPGRFGVQYRWVADDVRYPDLSGMIADLHARDVHFLGYANPFVIPGLDHYEAMSRDGLLLRDEAGATYDMDIIELRGSMPDFTREETYTYVEGALGRMVTDQGMDGWMADFGEWLPLDAALADGRNARGYHNEYPAAWHHASRAALDRARPDGDYVMFSRSGWTGSQREVQIVWIGDQETTFDADDGLRTVIPALLSLGISGIPYVTHDIAGFSGGPSSQELWMRWCELGALTPIMRTHEGALRDSNWDWDRDPETTEHFRRMSALHAALAPEWLALAEEASRTSAPMLRPLSFAAPMDLDARAIDDQFLIGDALLVAPVLDAGATEREVYLPSGTWFFVWTGERFDGGARVTVPAPIGQPPIFSRDVDRPDLRAPL